MEVGKKVIYDDVEYIIFYTYQNGYCEIKEVTDSSYTNVRLVPLSNIKLVS